MTKAKLQSSMLVDNLPQALGRTTNNLIPCQHIPHRYLKSCPISISTNILHLHSQPRFSNTIPVLRLLHQYTPFSTVCLPSFPNNLRFIQTIRSIMPTHDHRHTLAGESSLAHESNVTNERPFHCVPAVSAPHTGSVAANMGDNIFQHRKT